MRVHTVSVNICVHLWMCISILSLLVHVRLCTLHLVWSENLSWCLGMNGIFWDRSVLLYVCQTSCASIAHTYTNTHTREKQPVPGCCWAQYPRRAQIMQDTAAWEYLTFFYKFTDICTNRTKIDIVSIRLLSIRISVNAECFLGSVRVRFQMLRHFSVVSFIDFQPHS